MAYRLIHRVARQEVRFPNRLAAQEYADQFGGGLANWDIATTGADVIRPAAVTSPKSV